MRSMLAIAVTALAITAAVTAAQQRSGPAAAPAPLPPLMMTCVHHPDVLESKAGTCPYCKLPLVPVRLDSAWMCPVHTTVIESSAGSCRLCRRQLVPVTVSLTWTCAADRLEHLEPGACADGSPRVGHRTLRAHGNHNPQHGGQFFMAPDNWHHIEGVHPSDRLFRLFVYDDFGRPLSDAKVTALAARVVTKEVFDPATRQTKELSAFPLKPVPNQPYLEARIAPATLPAQMTAKVKFGDDQQEYRFDFTFASLTKEPTAPTGRPVVTQPASTAAPKRAATVPAPASPALDPLTPAPIPPSLGGMLERLQLRRRHVSDLIARGELAAVWVPAFEARDVAIALEPQIARLSPDRRDAAESAAARVVRAAWLLDAAGDVGNRAQIDVAHGAFTIAIADLVSALGGLK